MAGVQKVKLNNLNINLKNALIIGIIIAKNSPKVFNSKKKNGDSRGVTSLTLRDSDIDTINVDIWGSEYYIITFYERFLVGDVVEITSPKICVKTSQNDMFRPYVSSPFYLSLNEGTSEVTIHNDNTYSMYLPLLHIPTKLSAAYHGLADILELPEQSTNVYVDLLVVVKSVKPVKQITTKKGSQMSIRSVEIMDNTTPASLLLTIFDLDTIQRAEEWIPLESVLFIADARVSWHGRAVSVIVSVRTVITHQPHTGDAETLSLHIRNQANTLVKSHSDTDGAEAAAWAEWSGQRASAASVAQVRDRLAAGAPFCASLHAILTHLDMEEAINNITDNKDGGLRVRFADYTGELTARLPVNVLADNLGLSSERLKAMSAEERSAVGWRILLEQCCAKLAGSPSGLIVLALRRALSIDPLPLY